MLTATGILKVKNQEQQISEKFKKREFVLTVDPTSNYPQFVSFQLTQDKCGLLDQFNEGDEIKVNFNLRGREWRTKEGELKYFNSLEAWKLESSGTAQKSSPEPEESTDMTFSPSKEETDLPF